MKMMNWKLGHVLGNDYWMFRLVYDKVVALQSSSYLRPLEPNTGDMDKIKLLFSNHTFQWLEPQVSMQHLNSRNMWLKIKLNSMKSGNCKAHELSIYFRFTRTKALDIFHFSLVCLQALKNCKTARDLEGSVF